ncbi:hypothetical protein BGZ90_002412 [Linnemannia elongata]|nr:hypothetical protein BGZ90_002412 [Linnemannia elongata]
MQDLLTLVRGGRSSSVSTSAPSSLRGGFTFGKDGKIVQGPMSPTLQSRNRMFSSQTNSPTSSSSSLLYNNNNNITTTNNTHHYKDTQAHERHLDDTTTSTSTSGTTSASHNDHVYMTTNNYNTIDGAAAEDRIGDDEGDQDDDEPRIWIRTDRRLRDVRSECHPEVFECWREVDADLDKVERQLDSLLATVKAAIF